MNEKQMGRSREYKGTRRESLNQFPTIIVLSPLWRKRETAEIYVVANNEADLWIV